MFKFISSLFWHDDNIITLDEAYKILEEKPKNQTLCEDAELEFNTKFDADYTSLGKVGTITDIKDETLTIDHQYKFKSDSPYFNKGTKVSYNLVLSAETQTISNVTVIDNSWDVVEEKKSNWCFRTIICIVDKRNERKLILNPGDIHVDLNDVASEFVPIVGDWVQLDAKCELDEEVVDLNGKILEIHKIYPLRPQIKLCSVSNWDSTKNQGILNNTIYFDKDSLSGGYTPLRNDKVVAEIIESNQGRCALRALKIVPDFIQTNCNNLNITTGISESKYEITGISIQKPDCLKLTKLQENCKFSIIIKNELDHDIILNSFEFPKLNSQCKNLSIIKSNTIHSNEILEIACECSSIHMGKSSEYYLISTDKGEISGWIDILVETNTTRSYGNYQKNKTSYNYREKNDIVKGEKVYSAPRFITVYSANYTVPKRLIDIVSKYSQTFSDKALLKQELEILKPCLNTNLAFNNYLDKFHTLLYLEEINELSEMAAYDQNCAIFIPNNEFLMWEIENLSEKRPSIIVGDKVYARDSYGHSKTDWEGFVHKISAKHVYLKFSPIFHHSYKGEDYNVHVESSRTVQRRLHHAVDLAMKNLGCDLLFPTKINTKEPQSNFKCIDIDETQNMNESTTNRKETLKKMLEYKRKNKTERAEYKQHVLDQSLNEKNTLKLEWYNQTLNYYQKQAVQNVLIGEARPLPYIIFGPPGTGKTVTLVECILQILKMIPSSRLLVAAPSNSAADLIALRLIESGILRPGDLVRYVSFKYVSSIPVALAPFSATGNLSREGTNARQSTVLENGLSLGLTSSVLGRHRITVSTCSSAGSLYAMGFPRGHFTHILIDEAGQGMEPEIMIPLVFLDVSSGQAVLAGDPLQLGPTISSEMAKDLGLCESYVERILNRFPYTRDPVGFPNTGGYDPRLVTKLLYNYRSLPSLLKLTSSLFYNDDLVPMLSDQREDSEEVVLLDKLEEILVRNKETGKLPNIVFHGINGENFQAADSPSWFNPSEASQVFFYINELYRLGLKSTDIGVISPYVKQVKEIKSVLNEAEFELPRIGSVEEFQGQEYNVIILSTVRSNQKHISSDIKYSLGFIANPRRLNVAISRARVLLIIIGNPNLLYTDKYWQSVINYAFKNGNYIGCSLNFQ